MLDLFSFGASDFFWWSVSLSRPAPERLSGIGRRRVLSARHLDLARNYATLLRGKPHFRENQPPSRCSSAAAVRAFSKSSATGLSAWRFLFSPAPRPIANAAATTGGVWMLPKNLQRGVVVVYGGWDVDPLHAGPVNSLRS